MAKDLAISKKVGFIIDNNLYIDFISKISTCLDSAN